MQTRGSPSVAINHVMTSHLLILACSCLPGPGVTDWFIPSAATPANAQVELDKLKFFAKPKVALDSVGGESGLRLAEALAEVCEGSAQTLQHYLGYLDSHRARGPVACLGREGLHEGLS